MQNSKTKEFRRGEIIMIVLAVLNVFEYWLAVNLEPSTLLTVSMFALALIDAWMVVQYYMHLPRLFSDDGGH